MRSAWSAAATLESENAEKTGEEASQRRESKARTAEEWRRGREDEEDEHGRRAVEEGDLPDTAFAQTLSSEARPLPSVVEVPHLSNEVTHDHSARESTSEVGQGRPVPLESRVRDERLSLSQSVKGEQLPPTRATPPDTSLTRAQSGGERSWGELLGVGGVAMLIGVIVTLVIAGLALTGGYGSEPSTEAPAKEFTLASTLSEDTRPVDSVAFSPDGKLLVAGNHQVTIKL